MSSPLGIRIAAVVLAGVAYVLGCHWLMTGAPASPWNVVAVLTPMLAAIAVGAWRGGQRGFGAGAALGIVLLCAQAAAGIRVPTQWLYVAQQVAVNLFLAFGFGSTLRAGHTPLISAMARRVHREFTPAMALYTRHVTLAWTLYFIAIALLSLAIYAAASFEHWAVFANLLSPLTVAAMFAGEHLLRYRLHPEFERTSVADAIRSYMHTQRGSEPAAQREEPRA